MFYSHTYLGKKGPLGTVWCAAHLQHKLKKSQYASTHIPSTIERIIYPEVPIALRMAGHLLLGVVRIYSKKVEYLQNDCNELSKRLRNAFRVTDVDLAENATLAHFNAITLPETYALDALHIDTDLYLVDESQDTHLLNQHEITLKDPFPSESEYLRITFDDEDIIPGSSETEPSFLMGVDPMDIDPRVPDLLDPATRDPGTSLNVAASERPQGNLSPREILRDDPAIRDPSTSLNVEASGRPQGNLPPREILRHDPGCDTDVVSPILRPHVEPNIPQEKDTLDMHIDTPLSVSTSSPQLQLRQPPQRSGPSSRLSDTELLDLDPLGLSVNDTPVFEMHPSPSPVVVQRFNSSPERPPPRSPERSPARSPERPPPRQRRRKQLFDDELVLSNAFCKNALNDYSDLVKKRKKLPCSDLEMWRHRSKKKKYEDFSESLISGMCGNLQSLLSKDLFIFNPNLIVTQEAQPEPSALEHQPEPRAPEPRPESSVPEPRLDSSAPEPRDQVPISAEHLRSPDRDLGPIFEQVFPSSPPFSHPQSPGYAGSASSPRILTTIPESGFTTTVGTEPIDSGMFTGTTVSIDTPITDISETHDRSMGLSDIPESRYSVEPDELEFLEQDSSSPADSQGSCQGDSMSVRTRAVAQYLKNHSPGTKSWDGIAEDISLNAILQGKSRKVCARMFYETLVLKDYGLVDVKQDQPYGDITMKPTPRLSTIKI